MARIQFEMSEQIPASGCTEELPFREGETMNAPSTISRQEVALLKTAAAFVIIKNRFAKKLKAEFNQNSAAKSDSIPAFHQNDTCLPLGSWLSKTSSKSRSLVPSVGRDFNWSHCDHMMKLAIQLADYCCFATRNGEENKLEVKLQGLAMHLALQILQRNEEALLASRNSIEDDKISPSTITDWILGSFTKAVSSPDESLVSVFIAWEAILLAKPSQIANLLLPILTVLICDFLEESASESFLTRYGQAPVHAFGLLEQTMLRATEDRFHEAIQRLTEYSVPLSLLELSTIYQHFRDGNAGDGGHKLLLRHCMSTLIRRSSTERQRHPQQDQQELFRDATCATPASWSSRSTAEINRGLEHQI